MSAIFYLEISEGRLYKNLPVGYERPQSPRTVRSVARCISREMAVFATDAWRAAPVLPLLAMFKSFPAALGLRKTELELLSHCADLACCTDWQGEFVANVAKG